MTVALLTITLAAAAVHGKACTSRADCSYNGDCHTASKACVCAPQFTGAQCDIFNFAPLDTAGGAPGYQHVNASDGSFVSSWGGSVLLGDDGKYHMWAAEMTQGTGIKAWITNSQIIHAVADAPGANPLRSNPNRNSSSSSSSSSSNGNASDGATATAPPPPPFRFERQGMVWPVFAHEPTVARAPTGEYVMYFTTNYGEEPGSQCGVPCTCGRNGTSCLSCPNDQQCTWPGKRAPMSTRMSYASSPSGPWSDPVLVPAPTSGDTNLACLIRANHSLVCLGRPGLGALHADDWREVGGYGWHEPGGSGIRGEDPMVWLDATPAAAGGDGGGGEVLHAVTHGGGWGDPFGYHYWSTDGGWNWYGTERKAYENVVQVAGGGAPKILSRRERPHVVLDANGALLALTNGVTEAWPCTLLQEPDRAPCKQPYTPGVNPDCGPGSNGTSIWCPVDYCYTLWQSFNQA